MKAPTFGALTIGLLLIACQFVGMYYDARHGVAHYRGEVATALPAHR